MSMINKIWLLSIILVILIFPVSAGTYYVTDSAGGGDGSWSNPWTIEEGASNASAGDIIKVQGGTYIDVHPIISNSGTAVNRIVFESDNGTAILNGSDGAGNGITLQGSYITVQDFTIYNYSNGIYYAGTTNHVIENNTIYSNAVGINSIGSSNNNYANNTVYSNTNQGFKIVASPDATFTNNNVSDTSGGFYDYDLNSGSTGATFIDLVKCSNYYAIGNAEGAVSFENDINYDITISVDAVIQDNPTLSYEFINITIVSGTVGQTEVFVSTNNFGYDLKYLNGTSIETQTSDGSGNIIFTSDITAGTYIITRSHFNSTWDTSKLNTGSSASNQIKLPLESDGTYDFVVYWGDGSNSTITTYNQAEVTHTYAAQGIYNVSIYGTLIGINFKYSGTDRLKLCNITQWGTLRVGNNGMYFEHCDDLNISASDALDLNGTTSLYFMFTSCNHYLDANFSTWDTSAVTNMYGTFAYCSVFNGDITTWDTSNVTTMNSLFVACNLFNRDINNWDVSSVTNMHYLFKGCSVFDQNISSWDVSKVTNMYHMFDECYLFDQNISSWDVSNVTDMTGTFYRCYVFNQSIVNWDVSKATTMRSMFFEANSFNQDLGSWNVSNVEDMISMFQTWTPSGLNLSNSNYDSLLIGWSNLPYLQAGVGFYVGSGPKYSPGEAAIARNKIMGETYGWSITDNGQIDTLSSLYFNDTAPYNNSVYSLYSGNATLVNRSVITNDIINDTASSMDVCSYIIITQFDNSLTTARSFTLSGDNLNWYQASGLTGTYALSNNSSGVIEIQSDVGGEIRFNTDLSPGEYNVNKVEAAADRSTVTINNVLEGYGFASLIVVVMGAVLVLSVLGGIFVSKDSEISLMNNMEQMGTMLLVGMFLLVFIIVVSRI